MARAHVARLASALATLTAIAPRTIVYVVTEDWYFCSHRLELARASVEAGYRVVVATRVSSCQGVIRDAGITIYQINFNRRSISPLAAVKLLKDLLRLYQRERPHIVHHVAMKPVVVGTVAARIAHVPVIINALAGFGFIATSRRLLARVLRPLAWASFRWLLTRPNVWTVVQNDEDALNVRALNVPAQRLVTIRGSGVDLDRFQPSPEPAGVVVATLVARMLHDKGVVEFVQASAILRKRAVAVVMQLVGAPDSGNPSSLDCATLCRWHEQGLVRWLGERTDIADIWRQSHIGVLPSYREGLPKSLLEAAACARPLIATDVAGCRDLAIPGQSGVRVPPRDAQALADAIEYLVGARSVRVMLGSGARALVERQFSQAHTISQTLSLYQRALETSTLSS